MPERVLRLQGASNFRDLGGYRGHQGRTVRWRRVFRSDHLGGLSTDDQQLLRQLGVARSFDFRGAEERAAAPYAIGGLQQHALTIEPSVAQRMDALEAAGLALTPERVAGLMTELYEQLVDQHAPRYAEFFARLLGDEGAAPLVFHCTAGKDRTGIAAALLLRALGVSADEVEQDFLLSNHLYRRPAYTPTRVIPEDALQVLWTVRAAFLHHALQVIDQRHGGIEAYFERTLGLDRDARARLADRFLEG
ncbi:MAG: tyrosine-protein phosphatase [Rubrivivax sp.]